MGFVLNFPGMLSGMSHTDLPHFPRGFLLSERPVQAPPTFIKGPLLSNLYVHPWTHVDTAKSDGKIMIILGTCVSIRTDEAGSVAETLLSALTISDETFFEVLGRFAGRYAIIYGKPDELKIVQDATSMRSVFYVPGIAASHALLVEHARGGPGQKNDVPFRYGYPGNGTPYPGVRMLSSNMCLDLDSGTVQRFWPLAPLPERTCDEAANLVLEGSANALRDISSTHTPVLAFTAGLDSRTLIAVALHAGIDADAYTYGGGTVTAVDRHIATDLADQFGFRHTAVPGVRTTQELRDRLHEAHYSPFHHWAASAMLGWVDDPQRTVAVTANLLEIGRSFHSGRRRRGIDPPVTPDAMTDIQVSGVGNKMREMIDEYGYDRYKEISDAQYAQFIEETDFVQAAEFVDPFDLIYWEQRMSGWHGTSMNERDFYAEPFIPFNARSVFEAMLGVPQEERDAGTVQKTLIESVDPALLDVPVNPKKSEISSL